MNDFELTRFEPEGFIANSDHYLMTGAWKHGHKQLDHLLNAMRRELTQYGDTTNLPAAITTEWLLKNLPWKIWMTLISFLIAVFAAGVTLGQTTFIRELFGH